MNVFSLDSRQTLFSTHTAENIEQGKALNTIRRPCKYKTSCLRHANPTFTQLLELHMCRCDLGCLFSICTTDHSKRNGTGIYDVSKGQNFFTNLTINFKLITVSSNQKMKKIMKKMKFVWTYTILFYSQFAEFKVLGKQVSWGFNATARFYALVIFCCAIEI